jgi:hypothetical protein
VIAEEIADEEVMRSPCSARGIRTGSASSASFGVRYKAGDDGPWSYMVYSFPVLRERVNGWLAAIKRDLETPDLWAELLRERELSEPLPKKPTRTRPGPARRAVSEIVNFVAGYLIPKRARLAVYF